MTLLKIFLRYPVQRIKHCYQMVLEMSYESTSYPSLMLMSAFYDVIFSRGLHSEIRNAA